MDNMDNSLVENTTTSTYLTTVFIQHQPEWMWILGMVYLAIIILFGSFGNILVIIVELQNKVKFSTDYLIISMAFFELECCILTGLRRMAENTPDIWSRIVSNATCQISWLVAYIAGISSPLMLSAIAFDRYMHACHPLIQWYNVKIGKLMAIGISVAVFVLSFPCIFGVYADETLCLPRYDLILMTPYHNVLNTLTVICFFIITVAYLHVGRTIHQRNQRRQANITQLPKDAPSNVDTYFKRLRAVFKTRNTVRPSDNSSSKDEPHVLESNKNRKQLQPLATSQMSSPLKQVMPFDPTKTTNTTDQNQQSTSSGNNQSQSVRKTISQGSTRRTTLIMFLITMTYFVTHLSVWAMMLVPEKSETIHMLFHISGFIVMISCLSNPAYSFMLSSKFRESARQIICRK